MNSMHPVKTSRSSGSTETFSSTTKTRGLVRRLPWALAVLLAAFASPSAASAQSADVVVTTSDEYVDTDPSALADFRDPLSPYGVWVEDSTYGTVWVPNAVLVGADFAPYQSGGHWAMTADGDWLWVSDYEWGHIPFHYGRWVWISGRGWSWIPGRVYAPAWVSWRVSEYGYIGWAPMPPTWYWYGGSAVALWMAPPAAYVFCPTTHVFHHHVTTYVVRDSHIIRRIGAHSHTYRPAEPSVGAPAHPGAHPGAPPSGGSAIVGAPGGSHHYPKGPSLREARVPDDVAPKTAVSPDARALAYSTRSGTVKVKSGAIGAQAASVAPEARERGIGGGSGPSRGRVHISSEGQASPAARREREEPPMIRTPQPRTESSAQDFTPMPSHGHRASPARPAPAASQWYAPAPAPAQAAPVSRPAPSRSEPAPTRHTPSAAPSPAPAPRAQPAPSRPSAAPSRPSAAPSRPSAAPSRPSAAPSRSSSSHSSRHR